MTAFTLDHLSIFTALDAPEAATLEALGLQRLGGVTQHGNFGTASTSFFFSNAYLELFWSYDSAQTARSVMAAGIDVEARMRWRETGTAPFGVMLCPTDEGAALPFATTSLRADWMPGEVLLRFAGAESTEPYYAVIPRPLWYSTFRGNLPAPQHPLGVKTLTHVHIAVSGETLSDKARLLNAEKLLTIETGPAPLLTLVFDHGAQGRTLDVRPALPLVLKV
jgi:hypothetical protein